LQRFLHAITKEISKRKRKLLVDSVEAGAVTADLCPAQMTRDQWHAAQKRSSKRALAANHNGLNSGSRRSLPGSVALTTCVFRGVPFRMASQKTERN